MEQFPANSQRSKSGARPSVARVTSAPVSRRRKPLGRQFRSLFFSGDAKDAAEYGYAHVVIPGMQTLLLDLINSVASRAIKGERYYGGSNTAPRPNPYGHMDYGAYSRAPRGDDRPPMPRAMSEQSRSRGRFDDIIIPTRPEVEEVLERLLDLISQYESATVADLFAMTGIQSSHTDFKWGWRDLSRANIRWLRGGGYLLELPSPDPL